jgi:hypothetical protein
MGPSLVFEAELRTLWKGFTRLMVQRKLRAPRNQTDVESDVELENDEDNGNDSEIEAKDDDDRDKFKQGKEPMSLELFCKVCSWLLEQGAVDSMFAVCFFVHTWNLACQGHNTARIRLIHMSWNTFDAPQINLEETKTDKLGGGKQQKRRIYSNPFECIIEHIFTLALYLATGFTTNQSRGRKLFPGSASSQASRAVERALQVWYTTEKKCSVLGLTILHVMLFPSSEILPRCNLRLEKSRLFTLGKIIVALLGCLRT